MKNTIWNKNKPQRIYASVSQTADGHKPFFVPMGSNNKVSPARTKRAKIKWAKSSALGDVL